MKYSRLEAFGVTRLSAILVLEFPTIQAFAIVTIKILVLIISGRATSRTIATILLYKHDNVKDLESSKLSRTKLK
jgi:adenosylcobinamide-GDP ribazoletransferase